ncbi:MAG: tyrosine-type recombinase/integrase [Vicinamibacterales bacterium]
MTSTHRGRRKRVATGIYRDRFGFAIPVDGKEHRYPLGTPLEELRRAKRELMDARPARRARAHTLDYHFDEYLKTIPDVPRPQPDGSVREGRRRRDERALWRHWQAAGFGTRPPGSVKALEISQQLATWGSQPSGPRGRVLTPATLKHLRRLLGVVFTTANGRSGYNPVRDVKAVTLRYEEARAIPYALIDLIFAAMPDLGAPERGTAKKTGGPGRSAVNRSRIRLLVMAYTGLPPAQLKRLEPRDLRLDDHAVLARPRRKGAGSRARLLPLSDQGVAALRAFAEANCFGSFNTRVLSRTWRAAVTRVRAAWEQARRDGVHQHPWPLADDVRAYDLRHSFGTELLLATNSLKTVGDMLLHSSRSTTARYTLGAVDPLLRDAAEKLAARLTKGGGVFHVERKMEQAD